MHGRTTAAVLRIGAWITLALGAIGTWWIATAVGTALAVAALMQSVLFCALLLGVAAILRNQHGANQLGGKQRRCKVCTSRYADDAEKCPNCGFDASFAS